MCIANTLKGTRCKLSPTKRYCHKHINQANKKIDEQERTIKILANRVDELSQNIKSSKKENVNLIKSLTKKNKTIVKLKTRQQEEISEYEDTISTLKSSIDEMKEYYENYKVILEFERLKQRIKTIYNWDGKFYIECIGNIKYCSLIKEAFNLTPTELMEYYYKLRKKRNTIAHPIIEDYSNIFIK
jgi:predicted RNase H-like nuclease (RuvC/YqgF family)